MLLIVGLGNPGRRYARTRHNLGFMVVDELSRRYGIEVDKKRYHGWFGLGNLGPRRVAMLKPGTFMNRSGEAVEAVTKFYDLSASGVLVVLDDLALPLARVRIRMKGSAGGHKGLADIFNRLGTDEVPRLRIGIGSPPEFVDPVDFVLGKFLSEELDQAKEAIELAADAVEVIVGQGYSRAMDSYNRSPDE